jgi:hypothetical protein
MNSGITKADLMTIILEVGGGHIKVKGFGPDGFTIDGYLDLRRMAARLNQLCDQRSKQRNIQAR